MSKRIKILVITHKPYTMPQDKSLYLAIQSGAAIGEDLGIARDDSGDNISVRNRAYNELCPMYWAWKNLDLDYIGVCHYRRLFADNIYNGNSYDDVLQKDTIMKLLEQYDIILPPKRRYFFSNVEKHYVSSVKGYRTTHQEDLVAMKKAIQDVAPEYLNAFEEVMNSSEVHMFHMCVMKREKYDEYCKLMYAVMDRTEELLINRKDKSRYIGALSEFMMDIWLRKQGYAYFELGLVELERENMVLRVIKYLKRRML